MRFTSTNNNVRLFDIHSRFFNFINSTYSQKDNSSSSNYSHYSNSHFLKAAYLIIGLTFLTFTQKKAKNECAEEKKSYKRNELTERAFILQYPANEPVEDRFNCHQFKNFNGYYAAVFDGHAGWQVAEYAMRKMHIYLDEELKGAKTDDQIKKAILKAYSRVENDWINLAKQAFDMGYPQTAYVGSCALVAVVHNNKLYVANAGDSKGVLLRHKNDGSYEPIKISTTFNANKPYEQERLKALFKNESDVVVCKRGDNKACYVKGGLMPTRALGDLRLKMSEFNFHNWDRELGFRNPIPQYTGPYINAEPEIKVIDLTPEDKYVILASDGLWDEIKRKESAEFIKGNDQELKKIGATLFDKCLDHVSKTQGVSREFIGQIPPSPRKRQVHDDITILILTLQGQVQ